MLFTLAAEVAACISAQQAGRPELSVTWYQLRPECEPGDVLPARNTSHCQPYSPPADQSTANCKLSESLNSTSVISTNVSTVTRTKGSNPNLLFWSRAAGCAVWVAGLPLTEISLRKAGMAGGTDGKAIKPEHPPSAASLFIHQSFE